MHQFKRTRLCSAILMLTTGAACAQDADALAQANTVVVSGMRQSIRKAEDIKRAADQVVDSINAEDIGKFPDRSVGEALQRIPGVQVGRSASEVTSVLIRGLPDLATTINGNEIFTGNGRRLSYQDLRIEGVAGLDVYKSATANQQEGGIAGLMDVRLRRPFDFKGFSASGFADLRNTRPLGSAAKPFNDPSLGGLVSNRWKLDGGGELGALLDFTWVKDRYVNPTQWFAEPGGPGLWRVRADGSGYRDDPGNLLLAEERAKPGATTAAFMPFPGGVYATGERERPQVHGALQWKVSERLELGAQALYMGFKGRTEEDFLFSVARDGFTATDIKLAPDGPYCTTSRGPACPIVSATVLPGTDGVLPYTASSTQAHDSTSDTGDLSLNARWRDGGWNITSDLAWTTSEFVDDRMIIDQSLPFATVRVVGLDGDGHGGFAISTPTGAGGAADPNQYRLQGLFQSWSESSGRQLQWRLDSSYRFGDELLRKLHAGVRLSDRDAEFHGAEGGVGVPGGRAPVPVQAFNPAFNKVVPGVERLGGPFATANGDFLLDQRGEVRRFYGLTEGRLADDPNRLFTQTEKTATVYLMADYGFSLGSVEVSGLAGVRYTHLHRSLRGNSRIGDTVTAIDIDSANNDVLPSLSAKVDWSESLVSHIGAGKTVTRPDFASLNPALSLTPATVNRPGFGGAGNPNLKPVESTSIDATLEYYFGGNGYLSAAIFRREIDGYLQPFSQVETIAGQQYTVTRPQNAGKGKLHGYELSAQKFLDFLPSPWNGLGAQANYTYISGETQSARTLGGSEFDITPLVNVARRNVNLALIFEKFGVSARLAYNRRDKYVESLNNGGIQLPPTNDVKAREQLDLSVGYEITPQLSLQFNAWNLLNSAYESYNAYEALPRDIRYDPRVYALGLRFKL